MPSKHLKEQLIDFGYNISKVGALTCGLDKPKMRNWVPKSTKFQFFSEALAKKPINQNKRPLEAMSGRRNRISE